MFVFGTFTKTVKIWPADVTIDNLVFRLHYRFTFWFLLAASVLVSSRQFIREHINCMSDYSVQRVINTFCFFSATYTVPRYHNSSYLPGTHVASSGVGPALPTDEIKRHAYYQWVPFVLFGMAMLFYLPHMIWKNLEGGKVRHIVTQVKTSQLTADTDGVVEGTKIECYESRRKKEKWFRDTYLTWSRFRINRAWAKNLVICEFLNLVNIVLQIYMVDAFLSGGFLDLGFRWISQDDDVLESVFPKMTKCAFHKYGPSGSIQVHDALCVMALNIINEKIFTILWFWFVILFPVTLLGLVWRVLTFLLHRQSGAFNRFIWGEISPGPALKPAEIEMIATKLTFSDWLFLYYIGRNMDPKMFRRTVAELSQTLGKSLLTLRESQQSNMEAESFC